MIHAKTRKRGLIDELFSSGLCISYKKIKEIKSALANSLCMQYERDSCVCPSRLKGDLFTVGAVDNIDHNPSARNAMESFHGTAISAMQFFTSEHNGTDRDTLNIDITDNDNRKHNYQLPEEYTQINPVVSLPQSDCFPPATEGALKADLSELPPTKDCESSWLSIMAKLVQEKEHLTAVTMYLGQLTTEDVRPVSPIVLMPLFTDAAHSAAMIVHAMKISAKAIHHLNPDQTPGRAYETSARFVILLYDRTS